MMQEYHPSHTVQSYVGWGAVIAGSAVALALSVVLLNFGSVVGLADTLDMTAGEITAVKVLTVGIWLLWVQLLASLTGGYLAGRLRMPVAGVAEHECEVRDGIHGLLVWAVSTLFVVTAVGAAAAFTAIAGAQTGNAGELNETVDIVTARIEENTAIIFAFCAAATSLIAAVVSWWAATVGGEHRDKSTDLSRYLSFRRS